MIKVTALRGDDATVAAVARGMLTQIIKPRVEEILEIVRDRLLPRRSRPSRAGG